MGNLKSISIFLIFVFALPQKSHGQTTVQARQQWMRTCNLLGTLNRVIQQERGTGPDGRAAKILAEVRKNLSNGVPEDDPSQIGRSILLALVRNSEADQGKLRRLATDLALEDMLRKSVKLEQAIKTDTDAGTPSEAASVYDTFIVGAGIHGGILDNIATNLKPDAKILVAEQTDLIASNFARVGDAINMNSSNRPQKGFELPATSLRETVDGPILAKGVGNLNNLPGGPIQVPDIDPEKYPLARSLAESATLNKASGGADILFGNRVVQVLDSRLSDDVVSNAEKENWPARYRIEFENGNYIYADSVVVPSGLGRPRLVLGADAYDGRIAKTYYKFADDIRLKEFPYEEYQDKDVLVIGAGDSANTAIEWLLRGGPRESYKGDSVQRSGLVERIYWAGQPNNTCEKVLESFRSRYLKAIPGGNRSGLLTGTESKVASYEIVGNKYQVFFEDGSSKVFDKVIDATGFVPESKKIFEKIIGDTNDFLEPVEGLVQRPRGEASEVGVIGKQLKGKQSKRTRRLGQRTVEQDIYFIGTAAGRDQVSPDTLPPGIPQNTASIFALGPRVKAFSEEFLTQIVSRTMRNRAGRGGNEVLERFDTESFDLISIFPEFTGEAPLLFALSRLYKNIPEARATDKLELKTRLYHAFASLRFDPTDVGDKPIEISIRRNSFGTGYILSVDPRVENAGSAAIKERIETPKVMQLVDRLIGAGKDNEVILEIVPRRVRGSAGPTTSQERIAGSISVRESNLIIRKNPKKIDPDLESYNFVRVIRKAIDAKTKSELNEFIREKTLGGPPFEYSDLDIKVLNEIMRKFEIGIFEPNDYELKLLYREYLSGNVLQEINSILQTRDAQEDIARLFKVDKSKVCVPPSIVSKGCEIKAAFFEQAEDASKELIVPRRVSRDVVLMRSSLTDVDENIFAGAIIGGGLDLEKVNSTGRLNFKDTTVGLSFSVGKVSNKGISYDGLTVGGNFIYTGKDIDNLDLRKARIFGAIDLPNVESVGEIRLPKEFSGRVYIKGKSLSADEVRRLSKEAREARLASGNYKNSAEAIGAIASKNVVVKYISSDSGGNLQEGAFVGGEFVQKKELLERLQKIENKLRDDSSLDLLSSEERSIVLAFDNGAKGRRFLDENNFSAIKSFRSIRSRVGFYADVFDIGEELIAYDSMGAMPSTEVFLGDYAKLRQKSIPKRVLGNLLVPSSVADTVDEESLANLSVLGKLKFTSNENINYSFKNSQFADDASINYRGSGRLEFENALFARNLEIKGVKDVNQVDLSTAKIFGDIFFPDIEDIKGLVLPEDYIGKVRYAKGEMSADEVRRLSGDDLIENVAKTSIQDNLFKELNFYTLDNPIGANGEKLTREALLQRLEEIDNKISTSQVLSEDEKYLLYAFEVNETSRGFLEENSLQFVAQLRLVEYSRQFYRDVLNVDGPGLTFKGEPLKKGQKLSYYIGDYDASGAEAGADVPTNIIGSLIIPSAAIDKRFKSPQLQRKTIAKNVFIDQVADGDFRAENFEDSRIGGKLTIITGNSRNIGTFGNVSVGKGVELIGIKRGIFVDLSRADVEGAIELPNVLGLEDLKGLEINDNYDGVIVYNQGRSSISANEFRKFKGGGFSGAESSRVGGNEVGFEARVQSLLEVASTQEDILNDVSGFIRRALLGDNYPPKLSSDRFVRTQTAIDNLYAGQLGYGEPAVQANQIKAIIDGIYFYPANSTVLRGRSPSRILEELETRFGSVFIGKALGVNSLNVALPQSRFSASLESGPLISLRSIEDILPENVTKNSKLPKINMFERDVKFLDGVLDNANDNYLVGKIFNGSIEGQYETVRELVSFQNTVFNGNFVAKFADGQKASTIKTDGLVVNGDLELAGVELLDDASESLDLRKARIYGDLYLQQSDSVMGLLLPDDFRGSVYLKNGKLLSAEDVRIANRLQQVSSGAIQNLSKTSDVAKQAQKFTTWTELENAIASELGQFRLEGDRITDDGVNFISLDVFVEKLDTVYKSALAKVPSEELSESEVEFLSKIFFLLAEYPQFRRGTALRTKLSKINTLAKKALRERLGLDPGEEIFVGEYINTIERKVAKKIIGSLILADSVTSELTSDAFENITVAGGFSIDVYSSGKFSLNGAKINGQTKISGSEDTLIVFGDAVFGDNLSYFGIADAAKIDLSDATLLGNLNIPNVESLEGLKLPDDFDGLVITKNKRLTADEARRLAGVGADTKVTKNAAPLTVEEVATVLNGDELAEVENLVKVQTAESFKAEVANDLKYLRKEGDRYTLDGVNFFTKEQLRTRLSSPSPDPKLVVALIPKAFESNELDGVIPPNIVAVLRSIRRNNEYFKQALAEKYGVNSAEIGIGRPDRALKYFVGDYEAVGGVQVPKNILGQAFVLRNSATPLRDGELENLTITGGLQLSLLGTVAKPISLRKTRVLGRTQIAVNSSAELVFDGATFGDWLFIFGLTDASKIDLSQANLLGDLLLLLDIDDLKGLKLPPDFNGKVSYRKGTVSADEARQLAEVGANPTVTKNAAPLTPAEITTVLEGDKVASKGAPFNKEVYTQRIQDLIATEGPKLTTDEDFRNFTLKTLFAEQFASLSPEEVTDLILSVRDKLAEAEFGGFPSPPILDDELAALWIVKLLPDFTLDESTRLYAIQAADEVLRNNASLEQIERVFRVKAENIAVNELKSNDQACLAFLRKKNSNQKITKLPDVAILSQNVFFKVSEGSESEILQGKFLAGSPFLTLEFFRGSEEISLRNTVIGGSLSLVVSAKQKASKVETRGLNVNGNLSLRGLEVSKNPEEVLDLRNASIGQNLYLPENGDVVGILLPDGFTGDVYIGGGKRVSADEVRSANAELLKSFKGNST